MGMSENCFESTYCTWKDYLFSTVYWEQCDHCQGIQNKWDTYHVGDECYCSRQCLNENGWHICDECNGIVRYEDLTFRNGRQYCPDCKDTVTLRGYHNNPEIHFNGSGEYYIGTEIETEGDSYKDRYFITDHYGNDEKYIYQMRDGSLDETGIEMITQPMSKDFWDNFDFEGWFQELNNVDTVAHDSENCGLHVHISKTAFGRNTDEQKECAGRVIHIMSEFKEQLTLLARRNSDRWAIYADEDGYTKNQNNFLKHHKNIGANLSDKKNYNNETKRLCEMVADDRYKALNVRNRDTYEFRIFRSTINPITYRASVELCIRLIEYAKWCDEKDIKDYTWTAFLTFKELPETMVKYIETRMQYLSESKKDLLRG